MPTYKLIYFNGRGRAEVLRMMFALKGVEYEDYRFKEGEWSTVKGDTEQFPLGQVPVLVIDGKVMPQSIAIGRYLAREFGYYGDSTLDAARIDEVCETMNDIQNNVVGAFREKDEAKKAEIRKTFREKTSKPFLNFLQDRIRQGGGKYFVGNKLSVADMVVFNMLETLMTTKMAAMEGLVEDYPGLVAFLKGIREDSPLKSYIATRPDSMF